MPDIIDTDATPGVVEAPEQPVLPQARLVLTEQAGNAGGFSIGLGLWSHSQDTTGDNFRVPPVDVVVAALAKILVDQPPEFKARVDQINTAMVELGEALERGEYAEDAIAKFNKDTGGVFGAAG